MRIKEHPTNAPVFTKEPSVVSVVPAVTPAKVALAVVLVVAKELEADVLVEYDPEEDGFTVLLVGFWKGGTVTPLSPMKD